MKYAMTQTAEDTLDYMIQLHTNYHLCKKGLSDEDFKDLLVDLIKVEVKYNKRIMLQEITDKFRKINLEIE